MTEEELQVKRGSELENVTFLYILFNIFNLIYQKSQNFFKIHTAQIEVIRKDNNIEKLYFYIPPFCHSLKDDKDTKN